MIRPKIHFRDVLFLMLEFSVYELAKLLTKTKITERRKTRHLSYSRNQIACKETCWYMYKKLHRTGQGFGACQQGRFRSTPTGNSILDFGKEVIFLLMTVLVANNLKEFFNEFNLLYTWGPSFVKFLPRNDSENLLFSIIFNLVFSLQILFCALFWWNVNKIFEILIRNLVSFYQLSGNKFLPVRTLIFKY